MGPYFKYLLYTQSPVKVFGFGAASASKRVKHNALFKLGCQFFGKFNGIGVYGHAVDAALNKEFAEFRIYTRRLAADRNGFAVFVGNLDEVADSAAYCQIAFVINMGYGVVVAVAAQNKHRRLCRVQGLRLP